jgi:Tfp pilus assembly protein PilV
MEKICILRFRPTKGPTSVPSSLRHKQDASGWNDTNAASRGFILYDVLIAVLMGMLIYSSVLALSTVICRTYAKAEVIMAASRYGRACMEEFRVQADPSFSDTHTENNRTYIATGTRVSGNTGCCYDVMKVVAPDGTEICFKRLCRASQNGL